ncbi:alpha/beta hydrolase family protein [Streptomyces sp. NPDC018031]|uniref:alpha/beta hydrolase family protein n=1 Tax=Streptomyces sp. NPDC018031 TaxID=3365033 RepID=UPI0037A590A6
MSVPHPPTAAPGAAAPVPRRGLLALGAAATLLLGTRTAAPAAAAPHRTPAAPLPPSGALELPAPTGPYPVGTVSLRLVDRHRPDPWVAGRRCRELMVSVRYPARDTDRYPLAPHMTRGVAAGFDELNGLGVPKGRVDWAATRGHAREGAPVARRGGRLPVVLASPGVGDPRAMGTTLVDELASRGYVVVTVDHTYDAAAVEFPGGRVEHSRLPEEFAEAQRTGRVTELLRKTLAVRVTDTRFVLDRLELLAAGHNPDADAAPLPTGLRGAVDLRATGMLGHSAGGFTAAQALLEDRRIDAAVNMDGVLGYVQRYEDPSHPATVATQGVDRPLLLMGHEGHDHRTDPSWGALRRHSTGPVSERTLAGGRHASFTDAEALLPQVARLLGLPEQTVTDSIGPADPVRAVALQRAWVSGFFDRWLRAGSRI